MKIAILGAGVVGVSTAYELAFDDSSREISVFDVASEVASQASAANASMIAPGHAYAWASPKVPAILLKSLYRNDQAFRIRLRFDRKFWKWTALFLKQCSDRAAELNTRRKHELCLYSQHRLNQVSDRHQLEYDRVAKGLLYLYRQQAHFKTGVERSRLLSSLGQSIDVLSPQQVAQLDPAFEDAMPKIAGALHSSTDETGSCKRFTEELVALSESRGVRFHHGCKVEALSKRGARIESVRTSEGTYDADIFVVSLGAQTPLLLDRVGIDLPIYPVKGYSVTLPRERSSKLLTIGAVDEEKLVACAPMGNDFRITATAEFSGYDLSHKPKDFAPMISAIKEILPNAADYQKPRFHTCFRPMTPQGTPYIGFTKLDNLFVNAGQGHMGWTMACGSARIAADLISGKQTDIDASTFSPMVRL